MSWVECNPTKWHRYEFNLISWHHILNFEFTQPDESGDAEHTFLITWNIQFQLIDIFHSNRIDLTGVPKNFSRSYYRFSIHISIIIMFFVLLPSFCHWVVINVPASWLIKSVRWFQVSLSISILLSLTVFFLLLAGRYRYEKFYKKFI